MTASATTAPADSPPAPTPGAQRAGEPAGATVFVSSRCVNRCVFCAPAAIRDRGDEVPSEEIRRFIQAAAARGARHLSFSGAGEPTLNAELEDHVATAREAGFRAITVFTNGHGLDDGLLGRLVGAGVTSFLVSLHGTQEVHDAVVGRRGSFTEAISAIRRIRAAGLHITVNTCVTRSAAPILGELLPLVQSLAPARHVLAFPEWSGRALENTALLPTYEEMREAVEAAGPPPPRVEVENVPDCLAPAGFPVRRSSGTVLYRDPDHDAVLTRDLNLANNTYLPACHGGACPRRGACAGVDRGYLARAGVPVVVRPGGSRALVPRLVAGAEPDPAWTHVVLHGEDVGTLVRAEQACAARGIRVVGFELTDLTPDPAELAALARLPGRRTLDVRVGDDRIFDLYHLAPLRPSLGIRILLAPSPALARNVHLATSEGLPVLLPGEPGAVSDAQLAQVVDTYLHERLLRVPVEPLHTVLLSLLGRRGATLFELYREVRPDTLRGELYDEGARCITCPGFPACAGYFVRRSRRADCTPWRAAFATLDAASQELRAIARAGGQT